MKKIILCILLSSFVFADNCFELECKGEYQSKYSNKNGYFQTKYSGKDCYIQDKYSSKKGYVQDKTPFGFPNN
jgi:hypothetical protein